MDLDALHFGPEVRQPARRRDGFVKRLVEFVERVLVTELRMHLLQLQLALEGPAQLAVVLERHGAADERQFERLAHELRLAEGRGAHRRDDRPPLRHDVEEPERGELLERLPHRRPAHAQVLGELRLGQLLPRLELELEDLRKNGRVDLLGHGRTRAAQRDAGLRGHVGRGRSTCLISALFRRPVNVLRGIPY